MFEIYEESHMNLAVCQMRQGSTEKLKDGVITLTQILKYSSSNLAKVHYLRGKTLLLLKYYQHAITDLQQAKQLFEGQFQ